MNTRFRFATGSRLLGIPIVVALVLLSSCTGAQPTRPPVDFSSVRMPDGLEGSHPYRKGLDPALLPGELAGAAIRENTIFCRTTSMGFRFVLALYDTTVLMMIKAPVDADVEAGIAYGAEHTRRNAVGAADFLESIMHGSVIEPGAYYSQDLVTASGRNDRDDTGLEWFTTEGESTLLWQVPRTQRTSFWFRDDAWLFGIEADETTVRDATAADLIRHLNLLAHTFKASANT